MARRRPVRRQSSQWLSALLLGALLGVGLVIGALWASHNRLVTRSPVAVAPARPVSPQQAPARRPAVSTPRQAPEVPPAGPGPSHAQAPEQPAAPAGPGRARVAVIFDDAGYSLAAAREVMALGRPVTISVLPHLPFSTAIAEEGPAHGVQIILHLPVQPLDPSIPLGPGVVTVDMPDAAIQETVQGDLATVPTAVGANNHEGSRGTADPRVMRDVISVIKTRQLFFVDSLTSPRSVAAQVAREMGVPTGSRAVFLDNENTDAYVRGQFHALIKIALSRGQAIAIGHVGKVTAAVLRSMLPEFDEAGIQLVTVSQLVR
ncbi:MAG TPA: divergent polysaccharide deacetylase family protein [bacterium]|nr:divergent polysaccharide deacetylase family protein [bacterium]